MHANLYLNLHLTYICIYATVVLLNANLSTNLRAYSCTLKYSCCMNIDVRLLQTEAEMSHTYNCKFKYSCCMNIDVRLLQTEAEMSHTYS
jgi:hypothetical protein